MLRYSRVFASVLVLGVLTAPLQARRPIVTATPDPSVLPDKVLARKAAVEQVKVRVEQAIVTIKSCAAAAAPGEGRASLEAQLAPLEVHTKDALWTYNVGNYEDAFRKYNVLERSAKGTLLVCDKLRAGVERCAKSVAAALERVRSWAIKIARIQDPTMRAHCETLLADAERNLSSLDRTCATTDPAWVAAQIPPLVKPLDDALRTAR